ncbi:GMC family oxidoreductase [Streptomyces platensis]
MAKPRAARRPVTVYALAGVRLFNGVTGLLTPALLIRRLDPGRELSPAAVYAFRLFGIRTVLLGLDLLTNRGERLREDLREGVLIHGSDIATAAMLGIRGQVPPRTAVLTKLVPGEGVLYPRAGAIGGCTAHHALISVYPYNRDWDDIARETGDASWRSTAMRRYFERLEHCTYRPRPKEPPGHPLLAALLRHLPFVSARYRNDARHGFDGRLPTALADPELAVQGGQLMLLMLSGIGTRAELARHGIPVRAEIQGVGGNLQDRYEVGVVSQMDPEFPVLKDCDFHAPEPGRTPDRCYRERQLGEGVYPTTGAVVGITRKPRPELDAPDLFIFGGPFDFRGYRPGYAQDLTRHRDRFTWAVLKSRTRNTAGTARLRSADPRDTPLVNFRYFTEGTDQEGVDLAAMADAVEFVRGMNRRAGSVILKELWPGEEVGSRPELRRFVRDEAWGHPASCSCKMGRADAPSAVADSRFRVRGVDRLRIVDASVFPRIPGFFLAVPVYMISEKASDVILGDAERTGTGTAPSLRAK